jgi:hypothetical protein
MATRPTARSIDHAVVAVADLDRAAAGYERLGFTLTPRAAHPDAMGTSNRLAQFAGRNFIELLEVDRPNRLDDHQFSARPARFSFGVHNRAFLRSHDGLRSHQGLQSREGMSMLALASPDARADLARLAAAGITTYAPFDFERRATLPDGSHVTVAFTLGFVTHPLLPEIAFFFCENRFPEHFWKPQFQVHANDAQAIAAVYMEAEHPEALLPFLTALTGGEAQATDGGQRIACGAQDLLVLTPGRLRQVAPMPPASVPRFAGLALSARSVRPHVVPSEQANGIFLEWRTAQA